MKKIVFEEKCNEILFDEINKTNPIFAKKDGKLIGMVVKEFDGKYEGKWILNVGGCFGAYGYFKNLKDCLLYGKENYGFEFFVEEE